MMPEAPIGTSAADHGGPPPQVEDNGRWFTVAVTVLAAIFIAAIAAVVHSLIATFR